MPLKLGKQKPEFFLSRSQIPQKPKRSMTVLPNKSLKTLAFPPSRDKQPLRGEEAGEDVKKGKHAISFLRSLHPFSHSTTPTHHGGSVFRLSRTMHAEYTCSPKKIFSFFVQFSS
ncbi:MAG: hypothetical protein J5803_02105 [Desulfovibrio sp.]|nr:hypothetical protein [Desulfovibrio sp.]